MKSILIILFITFFTASLYSQTFKTQIASLSASENEVIAQIDFTALSQSDYDALVTSFKTSTHFKLLNATFFASKQKAQLVFKSFEDASIAKFSELLERSGILKVIYHGELIATHQLEKNYKPLPKQEETYTPSRLKK
jgi:hypothetical protein